MSLSFKQMLLVSTFCMAMAGLYAQETPRELASLINMRASSLDNTMADKGYKFIKNQKSGNDSYTYWWNHTSKKCVIARTNNGRVASLVSAPKFDCDKTGNNNNHNNNNNNNYHNNNSNKSFDKYDLQGMRSSTAYETLKQRGYSEVKSVVGDGVTYKLWWNSRKDDCIKTTSKDYNILKVESSYNCNKSGSSDNYNDKRNFNIRDFEGMKSSEVYATLKQRGYGEVKSVVGDGVTYKLWWNSRKEDCIKTTSKNYYMLKVEDSHNCR